jgi:uncharacterized membrane protein
MWKVRPGPATVVLWTSLAVGTVLTGLTPPFQVPDEPNHFFRAYQLSEGTLVSQRLTTSVGGVLPRSLPVVVLGVTGRVPFNPDVKQDRGAWAAAFRTPLAPADRVEVPFANTALAGPVAYVPQALGIAAGTFVGATALTVLYFGRAVTLLLCTALTAFAIRVMPARPWTCVMLSLLPMTLFLRSSVSSDAPTLALSLLAVALCCHLSARQAESVGPREAWPLSVVAGLLALGKPPYAAVALLALAIPGHVFRSRRARVATLVILILVVAACQVLWLAVLKGEMQTWAPTADPAAQLALAAEAPFATANVLVWDLIASMPVLLRQMIGVLGWLDAPLSRRVAGLLGLAVLAVAFTEAPPPSRRMRWAAAGLGAGGILLLQAMNYVYWTAPGAAHVEGLQGRHLAPFVLLLLLSLPRSLSAERWMSPVRRHVIIGFAVAGAAATVLTVVRRYYL